MKKNCDNFVNCGNINAQNTTDNGNIVNFGETTGG